MHQIQRNNLLYIIVISMFCLFQLNILATETVDFGGKSIGASHPRETISITNITNAQGKIGTIAIDADNCKFTNAASSGSKYCKIVNSDKKVEAGYLISSTATSFSATAFGTAIALGSGGEGEGGDPEFPWFVKISGEGVGIIPKEKSIAPGESIPFITTPSEATIPSVIGGAYTKNDKVITFNDAGKTYTVTAENGSNSGEATITVVGAQILDATGSPISILEVPITSYKNIKVEILPANCEESLSVVASGTGLTLSDNTTTTAGGPGEVKVLAASGFTGGKVKVKFGATELATIDVTGTTLGCTITLDP